MKKSSRTETFTIRDEKFIPDICRNRKMEPAMLAEYMLLGTGYHLVDRFTTRVRVTVELLNPEEEGQ